jgi:hypothetical protein
MLEWLAFDLVNETCELLRVPVWKEGQSEDFQLKTREPFHPLIEIGNFQPVPSSYSHLVVQREGQDQSFLMLREE